MRFYEIVVSDPKTGEIFVPNVAGKAGFSRVAQTGRVVTYSSLYQGGDPSRLFSANPNALQVEFDIPTGALHQPIQNAFVRISGVSLGEIASGSDLNYANIVVRGGMSRGLPLAKYQQIGVLCSGQIISAFGNWVGTSQSIDFYITAGGSSSQSDQVTGIPASSSTLPAPSTNANSSGLTFQWSPGQSLMTPLLQTLGNAYPQYSVSGAVNSGLVWVGAATTAFFAKLSQFADFLNRTSLNMLAGYAPNLAAYQGVSMAMRQNEIVIYDGTIKTAPKLIEFSDLQGQVTLSAPFTLQATTTLRGDIGVSDYVTIASSVLQVSAESQTSVIAPPSIGLLSPAKTKTAFAGTYLVTGVRHVGNSRQGSGSSWVTVIELLQTAPGDPTSTLSLPVVKKQDPSRFKFFLP